MKEPVINSKLEPESESQGEVNAKNTNTLVPAVEREIFCFETRARFEIR